MNIPHTIRFHSLSRIFLSLLLLCITFSLVAPQSIQAIPCREQDRRCITGILSENSGEAPSGSFRIEIRASEPHGLFYLLQCLSGKDHRSEKLVSFFREKRGNHSEDEEALLGFKKLVSEDWGRVSIPGDGGRTRTVEDVLEAMAIQSGSVEEFLRQAQTLLDNEDYLRLSRAMHHFEPLYRRIILEPCRCGLEMQVTNLQKAVEKIRMGALLKKVAVCFESKWPQERRFMVELVPIPRAPGEHMNSFGHCDGNLEIVEAPSGASMEGTCGVVFHELCHSLWSTRDEAQSKALRKSFMEADGFQAYDELGEAVATALGNGWIEEKIKGSLPSGQWYNDSYIDRYAKALYPVLIPYVESGRPLDSTFAKEAVGVFKKRFPEAGQDPVLLLREIVFFSDSPEVAGRSFQGSLSRMGRIVSSHACCPLHSSISLTKFKEKGQIPAVFLVRPEELMKLQDYSLQKEDLEKVAVLCKNELPLLWMGKRDSRWLILCIGDTFEKQGEMLKKLMEKKVLTESP